MDGVSICITIELVKEQLKFVDLCCYGTSVCRNLHNNIIADDKS